MPPGSVSGAPKSSALRAIADLEPVARGPYCGAVGWVDADARHRVPGRRDPHLLVEDRAASGSAGGPRIWFGTGAGITWGSDPGGEWAETELKAARLIGLASTPDRSDLDHLDSDHPDDPDLADRHDPDPPGGQR